MCLKALETKACLKLMKSSAVSVPALAEASLGMIESQKQEQIRIASKLLRFYFHCAE